MRYIRNHAVQIAHIHSDALSDEREIKRKKGTKVGRIADEKGEILLRCPKKNKSDDKKQPHNNKGDCVRAFFGFLGGTRRTTMNAECIRLRNHATAAGTVHIQSPL